jgi:hypothetical protein
MYSKMSKVCNNENCKGNPLIVMVTASPTARSNKCRMKHVVLLLCNVACLVNNIKKSGEGIWLKNSPAITEVGDRVRAVQVQEKVVEGNDTHRRLRWSSG